MASGGAIPLWDEVRRSGHRVISGDPFDWYAQGFHHGRSPTEWADRIAYAVQKHQPDVFVLNKGWGWRGADFWSVPLPVLWWIRKRVKKLVYISWDDPAGTPITIRTGILAPFDLYLTSCPGISRLFNLQDHTNARVVRFWLAHDARRLPEVVPLEKKLAVDVAVTGSPYCRPFPTPHYSAGFGGPRRRFVDAFLKAGMKVGIWGPESWLQRDQGGDPGYRKIYRGWLHEREIHRVHRSARVCLGTQLVQGPGYESGRFPFVGGAGGCLVHEVRPGLPEEFRGMARWFQPGHLSVAVLKVREMLEHPDRRDMIATRLHQHIMKKHTWAVRAQQFLRELEKVKDVSATKEKSH